MKSVRLRVATYNIHKGVTAFGRRSRVSELRMALHRIDADVVFLQEVQERNERLARGGDTRAGQLDMLASSGYEHRAYGVNAVYPHGHHGNAILSRWSIEHFANHDISDHMLERRGMLHAVARLPGAGGPGIHLICAHFGLTKRGRMRQAEWVARFIEREIPPSAPLILAGDFNDWQRGVDAQLRQRLGMREVSDEMATTAWLERLLGWRRPVRVARTFPSLVPFLTLDRIYVRGLRARRSLVPRGRSWARCSDHAPLIADLEL
jgi:endonuclease/exonuclease/phosphatase family metal-dependent hydrolase